MQWFRDRRTRGRPPHPDVLTPAEWRVLDEVRRGRSNPEIAAALGVSVNTVRTHVSSMLAKLDVPDRHALAAWRGRPAVEAPSVLRRRTTTAALALGGAAAATAAVALLLASMQGASAPAGGGPEVQPPPPAGATETATAEPSAVPEGSPTPEASPSPAGPPVEPAVLAPLVEIDATFLMVRILPATSAPPAALERVGVDGRSAAGSIVLQPGDFGGAESYINSWRNIHHPPPAGSGATVVAYCHEAACGGLGWAEEGARTTLVRTRDNGVTWEELDTLDGAYWIASWDADGSEVLLWRYPTDAAGNAEREFLVWPSMREVVPPTRSHGAAHKEALPLMLPDGRVAWWWILGELVDEDGDVLLDMRSVRGLGAEEVLLSADADRVVVTWQDPEAPPTVPGAMPQWNWTLFERNAAGSYEPIRTLAQPEGLFLAVPYAWLSDHEVIIPASVAPAALGLPGGTSVGYVPAIVDFATAEVRPLAAFATEELATRGNVVVGVDPRE